jgi:hypothetical protein
LATSLEQQINVTEDLTVFTLFALLNVAGYDDENRQEGMHPVRSQIRRVLQQQLDPQRREELRSFYQKTRQHANPWSYSVVAKATSGPPSFAPTAEWADDLAHEARFGSLSELHDLLRRFYVEARIPELYEQVRPAYLEYIRQYRDAIYSETAAAMAYCRLALTEVTASGERQNPMVIPNLLDSYEHAFSFILGARFVSVEGPQERIGYNPHEFIHAVTNPAVYSPTTEALEDALRPLVEEAVRALGESPSRYATLASFVDENLVRAIALRYLVTRRPGRESELAEEMMAEWKSGYILERFFWEQLAEYERQTSDIRAFYGQMIRALDVPAELERWQQARGTPP